MVRHRAPRGAGGRGAGDELLLGGGLHLIDVPARARGGHRRGGRQRQRAFHVDDRHGPAADRHGIFVAQRRGAAGAEVDGDRPRRGAGAGDLPGDRHAGRVGLRGEPFPVPLDQLRELLAVQELVGSRPADFAGEPHLPPAGAERDGRPRRQQRVVGQFAEPPPAKQIVAAPPAVRQLDVDPADRRPGRANLRHDVVQSRQRAHGDLLRSGDLAAQCHLETPRRDDDAVQGRKLAVARAGPAVQQQIQVDRLLRRAETGKDGVGQIGAGDDRFAYPRQGVEQRLPRPVPVDDPIALRPHGSFEEDRRPQRVPAADRHDVTVAQRRAGQLQVPRRVAGRAAIIGPVRAARRQRRAVAIEERGRRGAAVRSRRAGLAQTVDAHPLQIGSRREAVGEGDQVGEPFTVE